MNAISSFESGKVAKVKFHKVTSHLQRQKNAGAQISNKEVAIQPKFAILDVKNKVSFYASTSLDTKTLKITSNHNFENFMSIYCLAPQLCGF